MEQLRYLARKVLTHSGEEGDAARGALRSGAWTAVDHFEADGRRYFIIARCSGDSAISSEDMDLLVRRARAESLKVIAMDLGLSESTVSRRLSAAMKRLGLSSATELPLLFGN
jgi:DNA-binding NarL/FixJ family response regulator